MALVGPEPPPSAANPTTSPTTAPNLTLREVSALMSDKGEPTTGPGVAEQPPQLCVCCACRSELRRADAFRCSRCRLAFYCSRECQRSYHKRHVRWCKREAGLQAQLRAEHPHALVRTGTPSPPALWLIALLPTPGVLLEAAVARAPLGRQRQGDVPRPTLLPPQDRRQGPCHPLPLRALVTVADPDCYDGSIPATPPASRPTQQRSHRTGAAAARLPRQRWRLWPRTGPCRRQARRSSARRRSASLLPTVGPSSPRQSYPRT